jgi:hypothetical protein
MTNGELISDGLPVAGYLVKPFLDEIVARQIGKFREWLKREGRERAIEENYFNDKFSDYLERTNEYCSSLNTLVFPGQKIALDKIFQPVYLRRLSHPKKILVNYRLLLSELFEFGNLLISDSAGMGKSTIAKVIALRCIECNSIPVIIELRKLTSTHLVVQEIVNQIDSLNHDIDDSLILDFLRLGNFTIIFDALDEVQLDILQTVIQDIHNLVGKVPKNNYIITSRPEGSLVAFHQFNRFYIQPLTENDAFSLINKFDIVSDQSQGEKLVHDIKESLDQIREFLSNPLLVSLLYRAYSFTKEIPQRKVAYYEEIYSALYKNHDIAKGGYLRPKASRLDIHQMRQVLNILGFLTHKLGKTSFFKPEFESILKEILDRNLGFKFDIEALIVDLEERMPLFIRDGVDIKWAHKSIQDYFAASYIAFHKDGEAILQRIYESKRDHLLNVIDLIEELNKPIFENCILIPILQKFLGAIVRKDIYGDFLSFVSMGDSIVLWVYDTFWVTNDSKMMQAYVHKHMEHREDYNLFYTPMSSDMRFSVALRRSFDRQILMLLSKKGSYHFFKNASHFSETDSNLHRGYFASHHTNPITMTPSSSKAHFDKDADYVTFKLLLEQATNSPEFKNFLESESVANYIVEYNRRIELSSRFNPFDDI